MGSQDMFDYIVAGGGTAGSVLAARLSEDPSVSVLLIEAGKKDSHPLIHVPIGFAKLTAGPFQWGFVSQPQKHAQNREIPLAQGRVLGGGGSINAQVFTRGAREDYDNWEKTYGATGWGTDQMMHYFIKSEDNERLSGKYHGNGGPLGVSDLVNPHPMTRAWVQAGQQMGLPYNSDFNGESQYGVGYYQTTTRGSRRCSASVGYLRPARNRPNLKIITQGHVKKVVIENKRATGVEVIIKNRVHSYAAKREVIVTAGAYGSPKILQLSGIGDPADLKAAGVEVIHSLYGVGKNLQDHCDLDIIYSIKDYISLDKLAKPGFHVIKAGAEYALFKKGPLASTAVEGGMFSNSNPNEKTPNLQFHFLPAAGIEAGVIGTKPGYGVTLNVYLVRPESRGTMRIASSDPMKAPLIDPNYLATDYDLEATVEGLRQMRESMSQPAIAKFVTAEHLAGNAELTNKDSYIQFARNFGRTSYHPVGTCAMGNGDQSVVDANLKVYGIEGLRVADSSIMPAINSSNTQAPTVAIAEKAADLILGRKPNI
jgi:choline dehydrogenase